MTQFPSKLLLFGEYTIIKGSQALAIPLPTYFGQWEYSGEQYDLSDLGIYLQKLQANNQLLSDLDVSAFQTAVSKGLNFNSSIPTGYGLGSSGALCAAIYRVYKNEDTPQNLIQLKQKLAQIESFFHGASSGIDPLVSFLQKGVWIKSKSEIESIENTIEENSNFSFFLIDTQISRSTAPLVKVFNQKYENQDFQKAILEKLIPQNHAAIQNFLNGKPQALWQNFHNISNLQYEFFQEMIPSKFKPIWKKGIESDFYKLKLCGAGGGGFILGYTQNYEASQKLLPDFSLQKIDSKPKPKIIGRVF